MDTILQLIGLEGGEGNTWWKIVEELDHGTTDYFPALDENGNERPWYEWSTTDEYIKHKVKKSRLTVRYLVMGNPICAEDTVSELLDCKCMSLLPNTLDVYYTTDKR